MHFYFAPMEGITGYIYRNAYHDFFTEADKYFTPFLTPHTKRSFNSRERNDLLPEHNLDMYVVPQILTKSGEDVGMIAEKLAEFGYTEININAGCPSGTVVSKGRGAGLLADLRALDSFLDTLFTCTSAAVSIKTRIGMESREEFPDILNIYNTYPFRELIIHPRVRKDYYNNTPDLEMFAYAAAHSSIPLVYNGDIVSIDSYERICREFPDIHAIMLGRGILKNPGLIGELQGKPPISRDVLFAFHNRLLEDYRQEMSGDKNVLFKMKELWSYLGYSLPGAERTLKKIRKSSRLEEYTATVAELFS
ncbi:MAG: tRNA-dihydrouridine synthase family protein [Lachnospiraceae bacterium]|nr:tRNA-dihydrouridine synthase family protein [Lachnospiraceae bacterium]